ncbi:MAG: hypothetical protein IKY83_13835 [Proteobacteria bacterium]|nr:hypothetical protein [Pseudomonadota bacterium]
MRTTSGNAVIAALAAVCILCGCQSEKRKPSELSDDEKLHYRVSLESSLSESEMNDQLAIRREILERTNSNSKYEARLSEAMQAARDVLDDDMYARLEAAQSQWLRGGRGEDINRLVKNGVPAADAFGEVLRQRIEWLNLRTSRAMLVSMPSYFGGYYRSDDGRGIEVYDMGAEHLTFVLRMDEDAFVFTASGTISGEEAVLTSETDAKASVILKRVSEDMMTVIAGESFASSSVASYRSLVEGSFGRVKAEGYDVFSR